MKHVNSTFAVVSSSALAMGLASPASAFEVFSSPGGAIDDGPGGSTSFVHTEGASGALFSQNSVTLDLSHSWIGDLTITLEHAGVTVTLLDQVGVPADTFGSPANFNGVYTFADSGLSWSDYEDSDESTLFDLPEGVYELNNTDGSSLSDFAGLDVNGDWTLTIRDAQEFDTGELTEWSFEIIPAPSAAAIFGLAGVAATRRRR